MDSQSDPSQHSLEYSETSGKADSRSLRLDRLQRSELIINAWSAIPAAPEHLWKRLRDPFATPCGHNGFHDYEALIEQRMTGTCTHRVIRPGLRGM